MGKLCCLRAFGFFKKTLLTTAKARELPVCHDMGTTAATTTKVTTATFETTVSATRQREEDSLAGP